MVVCVHQCVDLETKQSSARVRLVALSSTRRCQSVSVGVGASSSFGVVCFCFENDGNIYKVVEFFY